MGKHIIRYTRSLDNSTSASYRAAPQEALQLTSWHLIPLSLQKPQSQKHIFPLGRLNHYPTSHAKGGDTPD